MENERLRCVQVRPGKEPTLFTLENTLKSLQAAVGGLIEFLDIEDVSNGLINNITILCNEEGKINGMEPNRRWMGDILCGTFYMIAMGRDGEPTSLPEQYLHKYVRRFQQPEVFLPGDVESALLFQFFEL